MSAEEAVWYVVAAWSVVAAGIVVLVASIARRTRRLRRQLRGLLEAVARQIDVPPRPATRDDPRPPTVPPS